MLAICRKLCYNGGNGTQCQYGERRAYYEACNHNG